MSKRFGRNQRRRAREALAATQTHLAATQAQVQGLEAARAMDSQLHAYERRQHDDLKAAVQLIAQQIGPEHFAFPAEERGTHDDPHRGPMHEPHRPAFMRLDMSHDAMMTFTYQVLDLLDIETHRDPLSQRAHFYVRINGTRKLAYAVNANALAKLPPKVFIKMLSETFARMLADSLKVRQ